MPVPPGGNAGQSIWSGVKMWDHRLGPGLAVCSAPHSSLGWQCDTGPDAKKYYVHAWGMREIYACMCEAMSRAAISRHYSAGSRCRMRGWPAGLQCRTAKPWTNATRYRSSTTPDCPSRRSRTFTLRQTIVLPFRGTRIFLYFFPKHVYNCKNAKNKIYFHFFSNTNWIWICKTTTQQWSNGLRSRPKIIHYF